MSVRTRFAPSPTGFLHIGGARTALFSWLYARHHQGQFILRIEDTDQVRSTEASVQAILDGMAWLGLDYDEGPFFQTDRYSRYFEAVQQLLDKGLAYRCRCTKERLEALRETQLMAKEKPRYDGHCRHQHWPDDGVPHVIRFKNPTEGCVSFVDEVYGLIEVNNSELDDLVLIRTDGHPTYNFAVVVDDWDMAISHVIRGDDHINNTPRQIQLFEALNAPVPVFAHLPMILGEDGKRLSKRHGAVSVLEFKENGILPHALLNYLVRLGWSYGDQELFSLNDMITHFSLKHVSRSAAGFNHDKLHWVNQYYQKNDPAEQTAKALAWYFKQQGLDATNGPSLVELVAVQAERCKTLVELCQISAYFYKDDIEYDENALKKHLRPVVLEPLTALYARFEQERTWHREGLQSCVHDISAQFQMNLSKIAQPLRVAITGSSMSPSIDVTLELLGKTRVLHRLQYALEWIAARMAMTDL